MFMSSIEAAATNLPPMIGGCRPIAELGKGGMGTVFRARQLSVGREVALKIIHPVFATDTVACERFIREIRAAGAASCPYLVNCHDAGTENGILYLIMELVSGGDVGQLIRHEGALPPSRAIAILRDAACGAQALHQAGLLHRDIKPGNIFLTDIGSAKLADLGLARRMEEDQPVTMTGAMVGTPAFMPPEQAMGQMVDARADIYSLGATFYAMLTGRSPFQGSSPLAVAAQVVEGPFPDPRRIDSSIPPAFVGLLRIACAHDRSKRHADIGAFIDHLDRARAAPQSDPGRERRVQATIPATVPAPIRRAQPPSRRWLGLSVAAGALLLVTSAFVWTYRLHTRQTNGTGLVAAAAPMVVQETDTPPAVRQAPSAPMPPAKPVPIPVPEQEASLPEPPVIKPTSTIPTAPAINFAGTSIDRQALDPLLQITSGRHAPIVNLRAFLPEGSTAEIATEMRGSVLVALQLAGRKDVIATHPLSPTVPARVDFSALTSTSAGVLHVEMRGYERGICRAILQRSGTEIERIDLRHGTWFSRSITFDHQPVVVIHEPVGWIWAWMALTYRIER